MGQHADLDINVMISQELRDIIACRALVELRTGTGGTGDVGPSKALVSLHADSEYLVFRCDGERPLKFHGLRVLTFSGSHRLAGLECNLTVSLCIGLSRDIYLHLELGLCETAGTRSLFLAERIEDSYTRSPITDWFQQVNMVMRTSPHMPLNDITESDLKHAFQMITSRCFNLGQHSEGRNTK